MSGEISRFAQTKNDNMFGFGKKLRKDLPAIDISKKKEKGLFGREKIVPRSKKEQRKLKAELIKQYPDRYFVDDLGEYNSIKPRDELSAHIYIDKHGLNRLSKVRRIVKA